MRYRIRDGKRKMRGFTIIEALTLLFIFSVVMVTFYSVWSVATREIFNAKNRLAASALANQRMEVVRGMPYADIGTKRPNGAGWLYGIPAGQILEDETVTVNQKPYMVHSFVQYIDDAFDGTLAAHTDAIPTDYKRVRIQVSWDTGGEGYEAAIISNFSPDGVESASNSGVLSVNVLSAAGVGVSGASVHVTNAAQSIDLTEDTDATGNLTLPGAPAGSQNYHLVVSNGGYYGGQTYPPYPTTTYDPLDIDASVVINAVNQASIVMDQDSSLTIQTRDPFGTAIPDVSFTLAGGRQIGDVHGSSPLVPVHAFSQSSVTDGSGNVEFPNQSYGAYTLTPAAVAGYEFLKVTPETTDPNKFTASPGVDVTVTAVFVSQSVSALLATVQTSTGTVISGASVHLSDAVSGYDATGTTDTFGKAYFPSALPGLVAGTYTLEVSASGYADFSDTAVIGGSDLVQRTVIMNP
jgi:type II secretory pathway pseudopilin PulG